jgi:outer membrane protein assembly factor BamE (lipoprotein component of BamABCDE complex)
VRWRPTIIALLCATLCACTSPTVTDGKMFNHSISARGKIAKGVTTKDEVMKLFGEPYTVKTSAGGDTWKYYFRQTGPDYSFADRTLTIEFDAHSVVKDFMYRWKETKSPTNRKGDFDAAPLPHMPSL